MMKKLLNALLSVTLLAAAASAQVPIATHIQILKAEDARRYDETLAALMKNKDAAIRTRAALAAGRIGNEAAIPALISMLNGDPSPETREMAAFALGEIESIKAADIILQAIGETGKPLMPGKVEINNRGRLAEAAGKIAVANAKDPKAKDLGDAIIFTLEAEHLKGAAQDKETVLLALTAALRARPEKTDVTVAKFLSNSDARVRADATNTLSRVRAKNANETLRTMLAKDSDPIARANAARALGAAVDQEAFDLLLEAATTDKDSRVRVSAIRSLGSLNDRRAGAPLLKRGSGLLAEYPKSMAANPAEKSELLEIIAALGKLYAATDDETVMQFIAEFATLDDLQSPEADIALAQVSPAAYIRVEPRVISHSVKGINTTYFADWRSLSGRSQGLAQLAKSEDEAIRNAGRKWLQDFLLNKLFDAKTTMYSSWAPAVPDALRAYAAYKPADLAEALEGNMYATDVFIRAAAAELISEQAPTKANITVLKEAFTKALKTDKTDNDAQLAILSALVKLDKQEAVGPLNAALVAPDYLLRKRAVELIRDNDLEKLFPNYETKATPVKPYDPKAGTKLGQVFNTDADYRRALTRKNGTVKAVLTTDKGTFTIDLLPEDAPLTVDNFVKLARSNYFNGLEVHRVVPNFVIQDGDPRGDGNGGPGWSIRCEINMVAFDRGVIGMALSGKDTGGSQWFATHSPQPHLDGGYTVFGRVNESGMKVVDNIVRGDKILSVKILEGPKQRPKQRRR